MRETFTDVLDRSVKADYIVTDESFQGLPPTIAATLSTGAGGVGGHRGARHDGARRRRPEGARRRRPAGVRAARRRQPQGGQLPGAWPTAASSSSRTRPRTSSSQVGSPVELTFQNGTKATLPVAGIYEDASIAGNWLMSLDTLEQARPELHQPRLLRRRQARRGGHPGAGRRSGQGRDGGLPAGHGRDQRRVPQVAGGPDQPAARDHHGAARRSRSSSPSSASRSPWPSACSSGRERSA